MRTQIAWCVAVFLGALLLALLSGGIMGTAPGFAPLALMLAVFAAKDLPVLDFDAELAALLSERQGNG